MLKIMILGIALAVIALSGAMPATNAETIPSPLQQVRDGVQVDHVGCTDNRVLMLSPSDASMCVFKESVLKLEMRGFAFIGEPFDMFPIKSTGIRYDYDMLNGHFIDPPVVSMSRLPNINETAIVEITYTNILDQNSTDIDPSYWEFLSVGWVVGPGFEIVDSGCNTPWEIYQHEDLYGLTYKEFVPLDSGESHTYRLEVRAVNEGYAYIIGLGFGEAEYLHLYLDSAETMTYQEHRDRYPEMHERPARAAPQEPSPPTKEERDALLAATPPYVPPTREVFMDWFSEYFEGEDPSPEVGAALNLILELGAPININMTDARQILSDAGYADGEIDDAISNKLQGSHASP